ncbi:hypothetical protein HY251_15205 [bacterium]|nr:hypothetical protein [bacterium]
MESEPEPFEVVDPPSSEETVFEEIVSSGIFGYRIDPGGRFSLYGDFLEAHAGSIYAPYVLWSQEASTDSGDYAPLERLLAEHPDFAYADRVLERLAVVNWEQRRPEARAFLARLDATFPESLARKTARAAIKSWNCYLRSRGFREDELEDE